MNQETKFYSDNILIDFAPIVESEEFKQFIHRTNEQETFSKLTEENIDAKSEEIWKQVRLHNDTGYISDDLQTAIFETEEFMLTECRVAFADCENLLNKTNNKKKFDT